jgi:hypothetical protein
VRGPLRTRFFAMSKRLFDYDPETGIRIDFEDTGGDSFALHYSQDAEPILEENKLKQSAGRDYYAHDKDMWRVASIPILVQYKWMTEHGVDIMNKDHWPKVRQLLNSSDYRYLKTAEIII